MELTKKALKEISIINARKSQIELFLANNKELPRNGRKALKIERRILRNKLERLGMFDMA